jgi:fructokinase
VLMQRDGLAWHAIETAPVKVADSVGAGDCFLAGMLVALLERPAMQAAVDAASLKLGAEDMEHILCHAIASASLCVQEVGCVPPSLEKARARVKLAKPAFKAL